MSLPIPLSVRIKTARADRHITRDVRSLQFRSSVPGGFAYATFSLDRPLRVQPDDVAYYATVWVYDARNGAVVWEGRLEDPGRSVSSDGETWEISAVGPVAHASDRDVDYILIDQSSDGWERDSNSLRGGRTDTEVSDSDVENFVATFQQGLTVDTNDTISWRYEAIARAGQKLGRVRASPRNGLNSSNLVNRLQTRIDGQSWHTVHDLDWSTTTGALLGSAGGTNAIPAGDNVAALRAVRTGVSASVGANTWWAEFNNVQVQALRLTAAGVEITSGYTNLYLLAHEVVNDLLGRFLNQFDGANASVDTTSTHQIDHMAWPGGVTPAEVLDDLMAIEPLRYWAAWESNSSGLHRFEWRVWPTSVRYEANVTDGFSSPGSADGLYNRVTVRWRGAKGRSRTRKRSQVVSVLDDAGLTREAFVDAGDNFGSAANAVKIGDEFLAEHLTPPNAGTLTIARPILDADAGRMVMPWEIRPGHLIRVRGVQPRLDVLNATARDGVTVFRIVSVDFDTSTGAATLELDAFAPSLSRQIARLRRRRRRS